MDVAKEYSIPFKGLKPGVYTYDFKVDNSLFEAFESPEIKRGACDVRVELRRLESMLDMQVAIAGSVAVPCDRCLEDCEIPVAFDGNLVVKFAPEPREYDGEVMWLTPADDWVDLAQYIYESIVLSLPYQRVHPEGGCNPEMLSRFHIGTSEELAEIEARAEGGGETSSLPEDARGRLAELKRRMEREEEEER